MITKRLLKSKQKSRHLKMYKLIGSGVYFKVKVAVVWNRIEFQPLSIKRGFPRTGLPEAGMVLNLLKYLVAGTGFEPATFGL